MKNLLAINLFVLILAASVLADIFTTKNAHGGPFWHFFPGSYALLGLGGAIGLVAIAKILAAAGLEQSERADD